MYSYVVCIISKIDNWRFYWILKCVCFMVVIDCYECMWFIVVLCWFVFKELMLNKLIILWGYYYFVLFVVLNCWDIYNLIDVYCGNK